mgnify:FL=1
MNFSAWEWALFTAAILLAFCVRGGARFGGGVVIAPLFALFMPLQTVVPLVAGMNTLTSIAQGVADWRQVAWREIARLVPFSMIGVAMGIYFLANIDARPLYRAFGVFITAYSIYVLVFKGKTPSIPQRWLTPVAAIISFFGGAVGSLFGGGVGPVFVIYLNSVGVDKDTFRATMNMLMLTMGGTRIAGLLVAGMVTQEVLILIAIALPLAYVAGRVGTRIAQRFDQEAFTRMVGAVLLASGVLLILK